MTGKRSQILLTKEGYEKLKKELKHREGELRAKLQETLNQMRLQGDLRENDGYTIAVDDFQGNEEKINSIKDMLENAKIVDKRKSLTVEIGSHVSIECSKGNVREYSIVGENEANPLGGKISYKSPIGAALMGKKRGDKITIETPAGNSVCQIKSIN